MFPESAWSAVVTSELQPALGLRWLLCYEEHDRAVVHLQKAAPKHWFGAGEKIRVENCPTRFGHISWVTEATGGAGNRPHWRVEITLPESFGAGGENQADDRGIVRQGARSQESEVSVFSHQFAPGLTET